MPSREPEMAQDATKTAHDEPKTAQEGLKTAKEALQEAKILEIPLVFERVWRLLRFGELWPQRSAT